MTVEDNGGDRFPIGMRFLAVDDDHTCLLVLETLLKKCQYQVTTTNQAIMAVKMLREDRNKYDLVISDVNMPDMDGFKLLELVGLEMDLPVIMLSAHSDTELVMKGVTHGACDYLLKPVRIKDLRNIWQHVVRRRKLEPKDEDNAAGNQDGQPGVGVAGSAAAATDQNGTKKRKDQNEEDEHNELENKDPSTQKKPRVVWTQELHCNFVAAVNQLGLGKAFPKKILDVMNVEGLTRENVASHLQKYRQYLKKAAQQRSMGPLPGMRDISYSRVGGSGDFRTFNGAGRFSSIISSSYQAGGNGMLDRLNSTAGAFRRLAISPSTITSQAATHTLQPTGVPASQNHGVSLVNQLSQSSSRVQEMNSNVNGSMPDASSGVAFGNQAFLGLVSLQQEPFDIRLQGSSNFHDENWTSSKFPTNSLRMIEAAAGLESSNFQDNIPWSSSQVGNAAVDISSSMGHPEIVGQNQAGVSSNLVHGIRQWEDHYCQNASNYSFTMASQGTMMGQNSAFGNNTTNAPLLGGDSPLIVQQSGFIQNNYTSLDDITGTIVKPGQINDSAMIDVEFGFDAYSLGLK